MKFNAIAVLILGMSSAFAQDSTIITFEGMGLETGVTVPGATTFSYMGSSWSGGKVQTLSIPTLYSSGRFSYIVGQGGAVVTFDPPVVDVHFFFASGGPVDPGTARAFDSNEVEVGMVSTPGFKSFSTATPIARVTFQGGAIDDFIFTAATTPPPPPPPPPLEPIDFSLVEGNWLNPGTNRQGLMFDYGPSLNLLFMAWFTYTLDAVIPMNPPGAGIDGFGQRWLISVMTLDGNTATGPLIVNEGSAFDQPPPGTFRTREIGTITIEFTACDEAMVTYQIDDPPLINQYPIIPLEKSANPSGFSCDPQ